MHTPAIGLQSVEVVDEVGVYGINVSGSDEICLSCDRGGQDDLEYTVRAFADGDASRLRRSE